jgi:hypothetical protein
MRLSELRQQSGKTSQQITDEPGVRLGSIRAGSLVVLSAPISARLNGRPVTITATADIVGLSPAKEFIDENGKYDWASADDFIVDDRRLLPQSFEQLQQLDRTAASPRR